MQTHQISETQPLGPLGADMKVTECYLVEDAEGYDSFSNAAFQDAKTALLAELSDNYKKALLNKMFSMQDATSAITRAHQSFHSKPTSKALKWLRALSSRVQHYGTVLDVLVQHHPEYVSLAWGAFKFVFICAIEYETLVKELSKALSKIADVLPRATVAMKLYRTPTMKIAATRLYSSILQLFAKALKWFNRSKLAHAIDSILKPWALSFEETLKDCETQAANLHDEAELAMQAEIRDMHILLRTTQSKLSQTEMTLAGAISAQQTFNITISTDLKYQKDWAEKTLLATFSSLACLNKLPCPGQSLAYCQSLRKRSGRSSQAQLPNIATLEEWSTAPGASILIASDGTNHNAPNFLVDVVGVIRESPFPVIWAFRFQRYWDTPLLLIDIISALVHQALQINPGALTARGSAITVASLNEAATETDWLRVLNRALQGLPQVFIILDAKMLAYASGHDRYRTTQLVEKALSTITSTKIKILVSAATLDITYVSKNWDTAQWTNLRIKVPEVAGQENIAKRRQEEHRRAMKKRRYL